MCTRTSTKKMFASPENTTFFSGVNSQILFQGSRNQAMSMLVWTKLQRQVWGFGGATALGLPTLPLSPVTEQLSSAMTAAFSRQLSYPDVAESTDGLGEFWSSRHSRADGENREQRSREYAVSNQEVQKEGSWREGAHCSIKSLVWIFIHSGPNYLLSEELRALKREASGT